LKNLELFCISLAAKSSFHQLFDLTNLFVFLTAMQFHYLAGRYLPVMAADVFIAVHLQRQ
jgi:hypothetical protein